MIYQIYFHDNQLALLDPNTVHCQNKELTLTFENEVIYSLLGWNILQKDEQFSALSWKFEQKVKQVLNKSFAPSQIPRYDGKNGIVSYQPAIQQKNIFRFFIQKFGKTFEQNLIELAKSLGYRYANGKSIGSAIKEANHVCVFSNYFVINGLDIQKRYRQKLGEAIDFVKAHDYFYQETPLPPYNGKKLHFPELKINYYPIAPFFLETFINLFAMCEGIEVKNGYEL